MLTDQEIDQFLDLIERLTSATTMSWADRRDAVMRRANSFQQTAIEEFCGWFDIDDMP